jgi:formylglycine-generating enzyme required for sulfatase activity
MYPHGAAACGAMDMAGMLEEWCANDKSAMATVSVESRAAKVLRGGDYAYDMANAACTYRDDEDPARMDMLNGCRLVIGKFCDGD